MERNMEIFRDVLLDIEKNQKPMEIYIVTNSNELKDKYGYPTLLQHLQLMFDAGLFFGKPLIRSGCFIINGLSNSGYDLLEKIRNKSVWEKTKNEIESRHLPKTLDFIAQFAGIVLGKITSELINIS